MSAGPRWDCAVQLPPAHGLVFGFRRLCVTEGGLLGRPLDLVSRVSKLGYGVLCIRRYKYTY